ncbi:desulfoferrodoxin [Ruminococcaceae bacterium OttesenSCG-928-L11]|nr:desulfoferrodoxin [Ruminococcaceae bacterium OttesenSCG-928-L11]
MSKVFYKCDICGNFAGMIHSSGVAMVCCGQPMTKVEAGTTDAAQEKHVPACTLEGRTLRVQVSDVLHPMTPEHYIQWIMVTQNGKTQRVELTPDSEPKAEFTLDSDAPFTVYEYCNLHGLWKK